MMNEGIALHPPQKHQNKNKNDMIRLGLFHPNSSHPIKTRMQRGDIHSKARWKKKKKKKKKRKRKRK
jgi:hypothetical protein